MSVNEFWRGKSSFSKIIFVLIVLYCIGTIGVLLPALNMVPFSPQMHHNPYALIGFAIVSFALSLLICIFHLSTMLRRRKRISDRKL